MGGDCWAGVLWIADIQIIEGVTMATKKFSPAQIAAQKLFAERARAGTLGKGRRKANPDNSNKPMAAQGLISYRYKGRYGFIMIGARDDKDALNEAKRSTRDAVSLENLEVWNGKKYEFVVKRNPDKSKPRAYVKRASQATGAPPSKRLQTRRKMALKAPAGYFPNPKAAAMMTGYQVIGMLPKKNVVGIFKTIARAKNIATFMADANGVPYGVKTVKVHKAHFAV
jgi:hypothetical protein